MSRLRRVVGAVAAAAALALAPGDRRVRAPTATIAHVERDRRRPADPGLRARRTPTSTSTACTVTVDGDDRRRRAVARRDRDTRSSAPRSWRSTPASRWPAPGSTRPRSAALAFIDTVPDDVLVGIVTFDAEVDRGAGAHRRPRRGARRDRVPLPEPGHAAVRRRAERAGAGRRPRDSARSWCCPTAPTPADHRRSVRSPRRSRPARRWSTWSHSSRTPTRSVRCSGSPRPVPDR